jgi:ribonuclease HI
MIDEEALNIYTDGSSLPKPRRGGIGIRFIYCDSTGREICENETLPGYLGATNNEMELNACVIALKLVPKYLSKRSFQRVIICSDSMYVIDNYKKAMFEWCKTRWLRRSGAPVLNAKLWKEFIKALKKNRLPFSMKKVPAHSTDLHNKEVDKLAKLSAKSAIKKPISYRRVRRKKSTKITKIGSIEPLGQRISVRIIEGQYLEVQKMYRYRYEVISKNNRFLRNVDFVTSEEILKEGHSYSVRLNNEKANPKIVKVFKEIIRPNPRLEPTWPSARG